MESRHAGIWILLSVQGTSRGEVERKKDSLNQSNAYAKVKRKHSRHEVHPVTKRPGCPGCRDSPLAKSQRGCKRKWEYEGQVLRFYFSKNAARSLNLPGAERGLGTGKKNCPLLRND